MPRWLPAPTGSQWEPSSADAERQVPEPEEPRRAPSAATRWRCGSGDSGAGLTPSQRTGDQHPPDQAGPKGGTPRSRKNGRGGGFPLPPAPGRVREARPLGAGTPPGLPSSTPGRPSGFSLPPSVPERHPAGGGRDQPTALPRYTSFSPLPR